MDTSATHMTIRLDLFGSFFECQLNSTFKSITPHIHHEEKVLKVFFSKGWRENDYKCVVCIDIQERNVVFSVNLTSRTSN